MNMFWKRFAWMGCLLVLGSCMAWSEVRFVDVTAESGIDFVHTDGSGGNYYIAETVCSGLALLDYDLDGDLDIYFVNAAPMPGTEMETTPINRLYRNDGDWTFTDVTEAAGVGDDGYGMAAMAGDIDNDGDPDLYVTNYGANVMYRNNGDGTFTDITAESNTGNAEFGASAAFADFNNDGWLDLFVTNYLRMDYDKHVINTIRGHKRYSSPSDGAIYERIDDVLYLNNGDGTFTDATEAAGMAGTPALSLGVVATDVNLDGYIDIYVACDIDKNHLWLNNGDGTFMEMGLLTGTAYDFHGDEQGSMGVTSGDGDGDGDFDLYATNYQTQYNVFYRNLGDGFFSDESVVTGLIKDTFTKVGWGTDWLDYDNDGDLDLFVANGHLQDTIYLWDQTTSWKQRNLMYENDGSGMFTEVSAELGEGMLIEESSRGSAIGDLDNDGDIDIVVSNARAMPTLLRNEGGNSNNWVQLKLIGTEDNRDALGARVSITVGDHTQLRELYGGGTYLSQNELVIHAGVGDAETIDEIEIVWPNGTTQTLAGVSVNQKLTVKQERNSP